MDGSGKPDEFMDELRRARRLLDVDHTTPRPAVVRAFRAAAKAAHPDHGGDAWRFSELERSYRLALANAPAEQPTADHGDARRARYVEVATALVEPPARHRATVAAQPTRRHAPSFAAVLNRHLRRQSSGVPVQA